MVATLDEDGDTLVYVAPITHAPPAEGEAIEVPAAVKRRLGLDGQRSWIVTAELNRFIWPGYDLRPISRDKPDVFHWGFLPVEVFGEMKAALMRRQADRKLAVVPRN